MSTGSSPRKRSQSASAAATAVLPTPVGPKRATTGRGTGRVSRGPARGYTEGMSVVIGTGVSEGIVARDAAIQASIAARRSLHGLPVDVAVVFATGSHLAEPQ